MIRKRYISLALLSFFLIGCSLFGNGLINGGVENIRIYESMGFATKVSDNVFIELTEEEEIEIFKNAINSAVEQPGVVDMMDPNYDVKLIFDDHPTQELYLWLNDSSGSVMAVEDTHTVYSISEKNAEKLYEILGE